MHAFCLTAVLKTSPHGIVRNKVNRLSFLRAIGHVCVTSLSPLRQRAFSTQSPEAVTCVSRPFTANVGA